MNVQVRKPKDIAHFLENLESLRNQKKKANNLLFEEIEQDVIQKELFVIQQTEKLKEMTDSYLTMIDYKNVLKKVGEIIPRLHAGGEGGVRASMHGGLNIAGGFHTSLNDEEEKDHSRVPLINSALEGQGVLITHVAGTIDPLEKERLKKLLFRATRGKALTYFADFQVSGGANATTIDKSVYIVVFQEGSTVREKILRICDSFMGQRFDLPPLQLIQQKIQEVERNIHESRQLTKTSRQYLKDYLVQINQIQHADHRANDNASALEIYTWFVATERAIYASLNFMRQGRGTYIGYLWAPTQQEDEFRAKLRHFPTTDFQRFENHTIKPPTYIKTNEFTSIF